MENKHYQLGYHLTVFLDVQGQREKFKGLRLPKTPDEHAAVQEVLKDTAGFVVGLRDTFRRNFEAFEAGISRKRGGALAAPIRRVFGFVCRVGSTEARERRHDAAGEDFFGFTRNVLAQALTNGYCAIPVVAGPCPHPNACLNCVHFRTDIGFLEIHKAELRETERVIAKANANGWKRQIEMNEQKRNNLFNIITSLERAHA
jgi:hypothetical protein